MSRVVTKKGHCMKDYYKPLLCSPRLWGRLCIARCGHSCGEQCKEQAGREEMKAEKVLPLRPCSRVVSWSTPFITCYS